MILRMYAWTRKPGTDGSSGNHVLLSDKSTVVTVTGSTTPSNPASAITGYDVHYTSAPSPDTPPVPGQVDNKWVFDMGTPTTANDTTLTATSSTSAGGTFSELTLTARHLRRSH